MDKLFFRSNPISFECENDIVNQRGIILNIIYEKNRDNIPGVSLWLEYPVIRYFLSMYQLFDAYTYTYIEWIRLTQRNVCLLPSKNA